MQEPVVFIDAAKAVNHARELYDEGVDRLRNGLKRFASGDNMLGRVQAFYPSVGISVNQAQLRHHEIDPALSHGFVSAPGSYETTLTRFDLFESYDVEQLNALVENHNVPVIVKSSNTPIPLHFALHEGVDVNEGLDSTRARRMGEVFDLPDLAPIDDSIADGQYTGDPKPLSLFTAPRIDYSLQRLRHYTGTDPSCFQKYIIFTNYDFYVQEFARVANEILTPTGLSGNLIKDADYLSFVEPGGYTTYNRSTGKVPTGERAVRVPQMPAYHLTRKGGDGITLVNIGVGPSNAKNITDNIAVLRPDVWVMLGHCAGLRRELELGHYILAHGYDRKDGVLDKVLPLTVAIPPLSEVQLALNHAVELATGKKGDELKKILRTGTVVSELDRNWELRRQEDIVRELNLSRAIGLDMESGAIAGNGYRFRVPYGTLLVVSDMPMHGQIKLPGMANSFYEEQKRGHVLAGIKAMELLRNTQRLHSRKLRALFEPPFR